MHKDNKLTKPHDKINYFMYMGDTKQLAENDKELETLIQTIRIYSQDIWMEFDIENVTYWSRKEREKHKKE